MLHFSLVQKNKATGNMIYSIRVYDTDTKKISFISTRTKNKRLATEILASEQSKMFETKGETESPTLYKAYSFWLDNIINNFTNLGTIRAYRNQTKFILDFASENQNLLLTEFRGDKLVNLFNSTSSDISTNQKRYRKIIWAMFFNWTFDTFGIKEKNPTRLIKLPKKEHHEKTFFTMEQIETILEGTKESRLRFLFAFMAFAGLRFFEASHMTWEQIEGGEIRLKGKGGKYAVLPIGKRLENEIQLYKEHFSGETKGRIFDELNNNAINIILKRLVKNLGIDVDKSVSCHTFRHSFASNLLRHGANIIAVSKLLRHENPAITLNIYSHVLTNDLKKTIDILGG